MTAHGEHDASVVTVYHVITPGDHFSPRTGSAVPTVIHGLAAGAAATGDATRYPQSVVVQRGTMTPRYGSARALEYEGSPPIRRWVRAADAVRGRVGLERQGGAAYFRPAAERLRSEKPGVVLAHNAIPVPRLLRDQAHSVILYAHNGLLRSYSKRECSFVLGDVDRIVCVSESLARRFRERLPRTLQQRIRVVGNGVDTTTFHPASQRAPGPLRVMFVGRNVPEKGADTLLEAARILCRSDVEVVVVGSQGFEAGAFLTPFEAKLRTLAEQVQSKVVFEPFVDRAELPALIRSADILVVPSRIEEAWALTVGEGMASGVPVVASRIGGIPEALGDAGILFAPADARELADALGSLIDDEAYRGERASAGLSRARARDWTWAWRQLAVVLDEIGGTR